MFDQELVSAFISGAFGKARTVRIEDEPELNREDSDEKGAEGEATMRRWISSLSVWHLKGFEQELLFRVSDIWKEYESCNTQLENYLENNDYIFFGLDRTARQSDLDKAFRRLAKLMHPDKNGGSEEAKAKFLDLKKRHEALGRKIQAQEDEEAREKLLKLLDDGQEFNEEAPVEYEEEGAAQTNGQAEDDSLDRVAHERKIWDMLKAAKIMEQQIEATKRQLQSEGVLAAR